MSALAELPAVLTVEEAASVLRIGRSSAYAAARSKELPTIRVGRCLRVPRHGLEEMLGANNDDSAAGNGAVAKGEDDATVPHPCPQP
jgi:excisionase family DNA binding protein